jgi:ArsR family transcriptional regulator
LNNYSSVQINKGGDSMNDEEVEDLQVVDEEKVNRVLCKMPSEDVLIDLAEFFKVFGDSTRMKIICALLEEELCVGDISRITNSSVSAISHQLRLLKQSKLVKYRKDGKSVYYSLDDEHVREIFMKGREHIEEA